MSAHHLILLECNNVAPNLLPFFCCSYLQLLVKGFKDGVSTCLLSGRLILVATESKDSRKCLEYTFNEQAV